MKLALHRVLFLAESCPCHVTLTAVILLCCSGSRSSSIHHHDARVAAHHVGTLSGHTQEVCGLRWSPDGRHLASGANDNLLCVWPGHSMAGASQQPIHTFTQHLSAVKVSRVQWSASVCGVIWAEWCPVVSGLNRCHY